MRCGVDVVRRVQAGISSVPRATITLPKQPFSSRPTQSATASPRWFVRTIDSWGQLRWTLAWRRPSHGGSQPLMLV